MDISCSWDNPFDVEISINLCPDASSQLMYFHYNSSDYFTAKTDHQHPSTKSIKISQPKESMSFLTSFS